jgi:hypothetical protein
MEPGRRVARLGAQQRQPGTSRLSADTSSRQWLEHDLARADHQRAASRANRTSRRRAADGTK